MSWCVRQDSAQWSSASTRTGCSPSRWRKGSNDGGPWRSIAGRLRALAWFAFLALFFFLTYNFANAAAKPIALNVAVLMFPWERHIPFLAWTIAPYWSSDVLYALSLLICATRAELDLHGKRLLAIQVFSVICFLAFPLRCAFSSGRPFMDGRAIYSPRSGTSTGRLTRRRRCTVAGRNFVDPISRAHRRLTPDRAGRLVRADRRIHADHLSASIHRRAHRPVGWSAGDGRSTGAARGRSADRLTLLTCREPSRAPRPRLSCAVQLAAAVAGFALSMVAAAYWTGDSGWLGKRSVAAHLLLLPYTLAAWINSRCGRGASREESPDRRGVDRARALFGWIATE